MMRLWKKSPALRMLLPFLSGIATDLLAHPDMGIWAVVLLPALIIFLIVYFRIRKWKFVFRFAPGAALVPLLFCLGGLLSAVDDPLRSPRHYVNTWRPDDLWIARITSVPIQREKSMRVEAEVIGIDRNGIQIVASGKIMLTLACDSVNRTIGPDDVLAAAARILPIPAPANPGEFDYASFLKNRKIFRQSYARSNEWKLIQQATSHSVSGQFLIWREYFIEKFRSHIDGQEEFSVLAALILGKTEFIGQDMMQAYASAGAIHILAVSGLHVGLIYVVLAPVLRRIFPGKSKKWLKFLIPASILWLYAGVTGFSPSVLRAALMFTAFIVADTWERNSSSYNTIGISAFLLLCWNPSMIFELGFQLSYLAVLGIILLQKKIGDSVPITNHRVQKIWQLTAVTLAAQITTFPLSMYYFHQFPVYFVFSNLIVIPISTVLLYAGLVFLLVCWIPHVADLAANISATITTWMNAIITWFDQLPMSTWRGYSPGFAEMVLLYILMFALSAWVFWKKKRALLIALIMLLSLGIWHAVEGHVCSKQNLCCIHAIRNHTCITVVVGPNAYVVADSSCIADEQQRKFHLDPFLHEMRVTNTIFLDLHKTQNFDDGNFRFEKGILQTSDFAIGLWELMPHKGTLPANPNTLLFTTHLSIKNLTEADRDFIHSRKIIAGNAITGKNEIRMLELTESPSCVHFLKDGATIIDQNGIEHHALWFAGIPRWR